MKHLFPWALPRNRQLRRYHLTTTKAGNFSDRKNANIEQLIYFFISQMSLVCRQDALAIRTTRSHWSEVIPALGEEDADGDDDEDEGGEEKEKAERLAHHHRRPPLPLLPA